MSVSYQINKVENGWIIQFSRPQPVKEQTSSSLVDYSPYLQQTYVANHFNDVFDILTETQKAA